MKTKGKCAIKKWNDVLMNFVDFVVISGNLIIEIDAFDIHAKQNFEYIIKDTPCM